jgi:hypothetical protein
MVAPIALPPATPPPESKKEVQHFELLAIVALANETEGLAIGPDVAVDEAFL